MDGGNTQVNNLYSNGGMANANNGQAADPADLILYIAQSLTDNPAQVRVSKDVSPNVETIHLSVAISDLGQVIGKSGRIARSLRTLLGASNLVNGVKRPFYELDIING